MKKYIKFSVYRYKGGYYLVGIYSISGIKKVEVYRYASESYLKNPARYRKRLKYLVEEKAEELNDLIKSGQVTQKITSYLKKYFISLLDLVKNLRDNGEFKDAVNVNEIRSSIIKNFVRLGDYSGIKKDSSESLSESFFESYSGKSNGGDIVFQSGRIYSFLAEDIFVTVLEDGRKLGVYLLRVEAIYGFIREENPTLSVLKSIVKLLDKGNFKEANRIFISHFIEFDLFKKVLMN